jgi:uncharacterized protein DUF4430
MSRPAHYGLSLLLLISIVAFFGCSQESDSAADKTGEAKDTAGSAPVDSLVISLIGVDSISVLDLLRADHEVDLQESTMGVFVKAIDSIKNEQGYFWLYSVNDSAGTVAGDKYITSDGDIVKWHYRNIGE